MIQRNHLDFKSFYRQYLQKITSLQFIACWTIDYLNDDRECDAPVCTVYQSAQLDLLHRSTLPPRGRTAVD